MNAFFWSASDTTIPSLGGFEGWAEIEKLDSTPDGQGWKHSSLLGGISVRGRDQGNADGRVSLRCCLSE